MLTWIDGTSFKEIDGRRARRVRERDRGRERALEGQVGVVDVVRARRWGVPHGASVAAKHVLESARAEANAVRQGQGWGVVARSREVVDEGRVLGEGRVCRDVERVLEEKDGGELRGEDEVGHGQRRWRRRCRSGSPASHRFLAAARGGFCAG